MITTLMVVAALILAIVSDMTKRPVLVLSIAVILLALAMLLPGFTVRVR